MPVKTFLNCTMPALVNISVGSLRGTSGDEGTISWPLSAKKSRKVDLISLTPLISVPSRPQSVHGSRRGRKLKPPLLDGGSSGVQKLCKPFRGLRGLTNISERRGSPLIVFASP